MNCIIITQILSDKIFKHHGCDTPASIDQFVRILKTRWKVRVVREWGKKVLFSAKITIDPEGWHSPNVEIYGENAAGDEEDLSWQREGFQEDFQELLAEVETWAAPTANEES